MMSPTYIVSVKKLFYSMMTVFDAVFCLGLIFDTMLLEQLHTKNKV